MIQSNFNTKYKNYLQDGFYGLDIKDEEVVKFLDDLFQTLTLVPGFKYQQIKIKFGHCRFYTNLNNLTLQSLIEDHITNLISK